METRSDSAFIDLAAAVWKRKWMVLGITVAALVAAFAYSMAGKAQGTDTSPRGTTWVKNIVMIRTPELRIAPTSGLEAAGKDLGIFAEDPLSDPDMRVKFAKTIGESADMIDTLDTELGLKAHYGVTDQNPVVLRETFVSHMKIDTDAAIDILIVAFEDSDPEFAEKVVQAMVSYIDRRLSSIIEERLRSTVERIDSMLPASGVLRTALEYQRVLAVLELSVPAPAMTVIDREISTLPLTNGAGRRNLMAIAGVFSALFMACFLAVSLEALDRIRNNPETVARFKALSTRRRK